MATGEDYTFDDDPTLSACCIRDLQERKQAAAWKAELKRNDPVEQAEQRRRLGAGVGFSSGLFGHAHESHSSSRFELGKLTETSECNISSVISGGRFLVCLALPEGTSSLEASLRNWIDGFDALLLMHRFKPSACKDCFLNENIKLPALVVWNKGERLLTVERTRLEAENETSLIARLTLLKRHNGNSDENSDSEEEETTTGRNSYFKCEKPGCSRTFHHVHVQNKWKSSEFDAEDKIRPQVRKDSDSDDF